MKPLKILLLEDSESDADILERVLRKSGIEFSVKQTDTREDYKQMLMDFKPDLILSDHSMGPFNSFEALKIFKESALEIPFILVTGTVSEEYAVRVLKEGADDYLLKNNLTRLPNAILHALKEKEAEREKKEANENLRLLFQNIGEFFFSIDTVNNKYHLASDSCIKIYGLPKENFYNDTSLWLSLVHPEDKHLFEEENFKSITETIWLEYRIIRPDNSICWVESKIVPTFGDEKKLIRIDGVTSDITSRKNAEKKLEVKCEELSTLIYHLSHDLKGPVASTAGLVNLSKTEITDPTATKYLSMIEQSNNALNRILNGIIQVVSVETINDSFTKLNLKNIVEDIINLHQINPETKKVQFITEVDIDADFLCHEQSIHSVLSNVINNAVSFRRATDPLVNVSIKKLSDSICIKIKDNGHGIEKKYHEKIFDVFFKANEHSKGSGLGLYIVKRIIEKLNGKITLESNPEKGTTFTIYLPL
ncbi:MAG: ATP-binding protein [Bacteroidota bacterium]|nr:ATP-binding protein [Bacteroidota bacterium]